VGAAAAARSSTGNASAGVPSWRAAATYSRVSGSASPPSASISAMRRASMSATMVQLPSARASRSSAAIAGAWRGSWVSACL
jgi:hypothetical protein